MNDIGDDRFLYGLLNPNASPLISTTFGCDYPIQLMNYGLHSCLKLYWSSKPGDIPGERY